MRNLNDMVRAPVWLVMLLVMVFVMGVIQCVLLLTVGLSAHDMEGMWLGVAVFVMMFGAITTVFPSRDWE